MLMIFKYRIGLGLVIIAILTGVLIRASSDQPRLPSELELISIKQSSSNENELVFQDRSGTKIVGKYSKYTDLRIFDNCNVEGRLSIPSSDGFNYRRYLRSRGISYQVELRNISCTNNKDYSLTERIWIVIEKIKEFIVQTIETHYHEPNASLLAGILLGEDRVFTDKFDEVLKASGTTHIISASGYNLSILVLLLNKGLFFVPRNRRIGITIVFIWFYALLASLSPSIVRAALMSNIALLSVLIGRVNVIHLALPVSGAVFVIISPETVGSLSFQLSLLSTAGIIYIYPVLSGWYVKVMSREGLGLLEETGILTLACTLAILPLSIVSFGKVSIVSLVVNILVLPVLSYAMPLGFLWLLMESLGLELIPNWISRFINSELSIFVGVSEFFAGLDYSIIELNNFSKIILLVLWLLFLLIIFMKYENNSDENFYLKQFKQ